MEQRDVPGSAVTILIAEDDDGHAALVRRNLERAGFANAFARTHDGAETLSWIAERFARQGPSAARSLVLLLDINMPIVDGLQVLRQLKQDPSTALIPVIVVTTTDNPEEIDRCYQLGCNIYVTKPVMYEAFVDAIKRLGLFLQVVRVPSGVEPR